MVLDKSLKVLRSKSAKWRGSSASVHSLQTYQATDDVTNSPGTSEVSGASEVSESRRIGHQGGPKAAWDAEPVLSGSGLSNFSIQGHKLTTPPPKPQSTRLVTSPRSADAHRASSSRSCTVQRSQSTERPVTRRHSHRAVHPDGVVSPRNNVQRLSHVDRVTSPRISEIVHTSRSIVSPRNVHRPQSSKVGASKDTGPSARDKGHVGSNSVSSLTGTGYANNAVSVSEDTANSSGYAGKSIDVRNSSNDTRDSLKETDISTTDTSNAQNKDEVNKLSDIQMDESKGNSSSSGDNTGQHERLLDSRINEDNNASNTNAENIKTTPRSRLRKHFSRLKPRVSSASPSLYGYRRKAELSPDDYVPPNEDPETMVSRHGNNRLSVKAVTKPRSPGSDKATAKTQPPSSDNAATKPQSPSSDNAATKPQTPSSDNAAKRAESASELHESAKTAYMFLKSVSDSLQANGKKTEPKNDHQGTSLAYQHQHNDNYPSNQVSTKSNDNTINTRGHETPHTDVTDKASNHENELTSEVNAALNSLSSKPRRPARRSSSAVVTKRDAPKLSHNMSFVHRNKPDVESQKEEISRQVKKFADSPELSKAGPHFQHLYLKRAEAIVQKQLAQKSQSLQVKVPAPSDMEVNEYAGDVSTPGTVPVLRMTVAKVKTSPQPVKTYIQVGNTVKEASFSVAGDQLSQASDHAVRAPKQKVNHMVILPSHTCDADTTPRNLSHHGANCRVHFVDNVVSEPQANSVRPKSSILKRTASYVPQMESPVPNMGRHIQTDSQSLAMDNRPHNSMTQAQKTSLLELPQSQCYENGYQLPECKDKSIKTDHGYPMIEDSGIEKKNRGTAIIAVHEDDECNTATSTVVQRYRPKSSAVTSHGSMQQVSSTSDVKTEPQTKTQETCNATYIPDDTQHLDKQTVESVDIDLPTETSKECNIQSKPKVDQLKTSTKPRAKHKNEASSSNTGSFVQAVSRFRVGSARPTRVVNHVSSEGAVEASSTAPNTLKNLLDMKEHKPKGLRRRRSQKVHAMSVDSGTNVQSILTGSRSRQQQHRSQESLDIVEDKQVKVDHSLMVEYLTLVKAHPEEYAAMQHCSQASSRKPVRSIVGIAGVFRRGHHEVGPPESIVVQAAYELGSKIPHPVCVRFEKLERQRVEIATMASLAVTRTVNKRHGQEMLDMLGQQAGQMEELTHMERCRAKLEIWLRGLSAAQQIKVKEVALKEMGEEAHSIRKWWLAQKYCKYLRQKTKPDQ